MTDAVVAPGSQKGGVGKYWKGKMLRVRIVPVRCITLSVALPGVGDCGMGTTEDNVVKIPPNTNPWSRCKLYV